MYYIRNMCVCVCINACVCGLCLEYREHQICRVTLFLIFTVVPIISLYSISASFDFSLLVFLSLSLNICLSFSVWMVSRVDQMVKAWKYQRRHSPIFQLIIRGDVWDQKSLRHHSLGPPGHFLSKEECGTDFFKIFFVNIDAYQLINNSCNRWNSSKFLKYNPCLPLFCERLWNFPQFFTRYTPKWPFFTNKSSLVLSY